MRNITSLVTSSLLVIVSIVLTSGLTLAEDLPRYWKVNISTPSPVINTSSFNLDFQVFSTVAGDTFNVEALNNGNPTGLTTVVTSTGKGGDSGRFSFNSIPNGTYSYSVRATNLADSTVQTSSSSNFAVSVPTATVNVITTTSNVPGATADNTTRATTASTRTTAAGDQVNTVATTADQAGLTDTSSLQNLTDVQGQKDGETNSSNTGAILASILVVLALGGAAYYAVTRYVANKET